MVDDHDDLDDDDNDHLVGDDDVEGEDIFRGPIKERALFSDKSTLGHIACHDTLYNTLHCTILYNTLGHIACQIQTVPCHEIRDLYCFPPITSSPISPSINILSPETQVIPGFSCTLKSKSQVDFWLPEHFLADSNVCQSLTSDVVMISPS